MEVRSIADITMVMREGEKNRTVADTKMNTNRSVTIVICKPLS